MMNKKRLRFVLGGVLISSVILFFSSEEKTLPKPKAYLRIDMPEPKYETVTLPQLSFKKNKIAYYDTKTKKLTYSGQNATIHLTYSSLKHRKLIQLVIDMEKLTFKHTLKADEINSMIYTNITNKVFGRRYDVTGDAASPVQFYATDSIQHFLNGSLYFNELPDYDANYPLIEYITKDIDVLLRSLNWRR
jgi:gliding motility-associated lipoprotein GldD